LLSLNEGVYQYKFVVDGKWEDDPINPQIVESPFGGVNSVVRIS
jgi:hypothetical protein